MAQHRRLTRRRGLGRLRVALVALIGVAVAWAVGLARFVDAISREAPGDLGAVEAIVVLTGGLGRLDAGLAILRANPGAHMFVSGVYRGVDVTELLQIDRERPDALQCCVTLGHDAINTRGNARETAAWVRARGVRRLHLVTANYHMARSLLEFRRAMPEVTIVAHPVIADRVRLDDWWWRPRTASLLAGEYTKYLAALVLSPRP
ncbi:MAG: YdcF family protein [Alphaproteobacteria bacterium]|nr:YdcF family protein [Alphaproteobacteria bacterium]